MDSNKTEVAKLLSTCYRMEVEARGKTLEVTDNLKANIQLVADWMTDLPTMGISFMGTCGNGKTTMMHAMKRLLQKYQSNIFVLSALDLSTMAIERRDDFDLFKSRKIIAIDDVGMEETNVKSYGNAISPFTDIIHYRYNKMLTTIISTNLMGKELSAKYGDRIADRMREMFTIVNFLDKSHRQ